MRRTGSGQMRAGTSAAVRIVRPSGLSSSEAIFDSSLFGVTPIEQLRPVASPDAVADVLRHCAHAAEPVVPDRVVHAGDLRQVDVDLVDAAVLDVRRDLGDRGLEEARIVPVLVEVGRQQHRVGRQQRGLHQAHARMHAEVARRVGGGGDHAAAGVAAQRRETQAAVGQAFGLMAPPAADHHRQPAQLRVAQQLDRRVERVHVEVGDPAALRRHRRIVGRAPRRCAVRGAASGAEPRAVPRDLRPHLRRRGAAEHVARVRASLAASARRTRRRRSPG